MSELVKIAVDAMGGDDSPRKIIDGLVHNHKSNKVNYFKIFGDENKIQDCLNGRINKDYFEIGFTNKAEMENAFVTIEKVLKQKLYLG